MIEVIYVPILYILDTSDPVKGEKYTFNRISAAYTKMKKNQIHRHSHNLKIYKPIIVPNGYNSKK